MILTRKFILLIVVGLAFTLPAQSQAVVQQPKMKSLPNILEPEARSLLMRGEFEQAKIQCSATLEAAALVTEPGVLASPFLCLGEALYGLKNYKAAAVAFNNSIDQLTESVGVFDPRLVQPLEGLGKTLMRMGKLKKAEGVLRKAKDLTHRNFGIYNLEQSNIVDRLTRNYFDRGELTKAIREQKFLFRANEEAFGEAPQLLPALRRMAKWQERVGRSDLARATYRRALGIMDRAYGTDDLRRVGPLRDYARSYLSTPRGAQRVMSGAGAKALGEVVNLYKRQEFTDVVDLARAYGELGDWYVIGGRRRLAHEAYSEAGKVLQSANSVNEKDSALFSKPVEIEYEDLPIGMRPSRIGTFPDGIAILEFEFTVTALGRVMNLVVIRDDLSYPRFAIEVGQNVKASRYRPRIVDGQPVDTYGVRKVFRYDFTRQTSAIDTKTAGNSDSSSEANSPEAVEQNKASVDSDLVGDKAPDAIEAADSTGNEIRTEAEETGEER